MDRIRISILESFARTTRFDSPLYRFEYLSEEVETKVKDSNPRKKDLIPFEKFLNRSEKGRSQNQISLTRSRILDLEK